jgi:hypothetical protein
VNFDAVYHELIAPAIQAAGLELLRAGQVMSSDTILSSLQNTCVLRQ